MDDDSGWNDILVNGWTARVRDKVADRVERRFARSRGVLAFAVCEEHDADAADVEAVHAAVGAAIFEEVGANLEELGSQAAWATYDEVWVELARRWRSVPGLTVVPEHMAGPVIRLIAALDADAAVAAGARTVDGELTALVLDGRCAVDEPGIVRWLATETDAGDVERDRMHALLDMVRSSGQEDRDRGSGRED